MVEKGEKISMQILSLGNKQSGFIMVKTILFVLAILLFFFVLIDFFSSLLGKAAEREILLKAEVLQRNEIQYKKMEKI